MFWNRAESGVPNGNGTNPLPTTPPPKAPTPAADPTSTEPRPALEKVDVSVRHGFLQCHPSYYWVRIDAIHMVSGVSERDQQRGIGSAIYAGGAEKDNGGGVYCALSPEEVMTLVERSRNDPGLVPAAIPDEGGETAAAVVGYN